MSFSPVGCPIPSPQPMYLTAQNVPLYLAERRLISWRSLVDGPLTVVDASRRNHNFKVYCGALPGFFVKQAAAFDALSIDTLRRDGRCYWLANNHAEFRSLKPLLPDFHTFDVNRSILVTALLEQSETVHQLHLRFASFPEYIAASLGYALAALHVPFRTLPASTSRSAFPHILPWVLALNNPITFPDSLQTPVGRSLLNVVRERGMDQTLARLGAEWRVETLVHGDLKWDNCLSVNDGFAGCSVRIIDWEIADVGDSAWDAGALIQAYIAHWIFTTPVGREGVPNIDERFAAMQPAMRAFWRAYASASGTTTDMSFLRRMIAYAAARLVQTAYEAQHAATTITPHALVFLEFARMMLSAGENAPAVIFGA